MITHGLWIFKEEARVLEYKKWTRVYNYPCAFFYTDEKLKIEGEGIESIFYPLTGTRTWKVKLMILRESVKKYGKAFAQFTKGDTKKDNPTILIGRDGRESGFEIKTILIGELENAGVSVIDGDILPTPTRPAIPAPVRGRDR